MNSLKSIRWICSKCGKTVYSAEKPGATRLGKCPKSTGGTHTWKKA